MNRVWAWIAGITIAVCILGLMAYGRSERRAYWVARGMVIRQAQVTEHPFDRLMYRSPGR